VIRDYTLSPEMYILSLNSTQLAEKTFHGSNGSSDHLSLSIPYASAEFHAEVDMNSIVPPKTHIFPAYTHIP